MKTIIAGSRTLKDFSLIAKAVAYSGFQITELVCGEAPGIDLLGRRWAQSQDIPIASFPALWDDLKVKDCVKKRRPDGKFYNVLAGFNRNKAMAAYAEALIAIVDTNSESRGTHHMIEEAQKRGLKVSVYEV